MTTTSGPALHAGRLRVGLGDRPAGRFAVSRAGEPHRPEREDRPPAPPGAPSE